MTSSFLSQLLRATQTVFTFREIALLWRETDFNAAKSRVNYYVRKAELYPLRRGIYAKDRQYDRLELATKIFYLAISMIQKHRYVFIALLFCLFSGCVPVLSPGIIEQSASISFQEVKRSPEKHIGKIIVVGGTIINAIATPKGIEWEVLQRQLGYGMEPLVDDKSFGRFLVQSDSMLDASLFKRGNRITFAAEIIGSETRTLDQTQYSYLLLRMREYHLWPEENHRYFPSFYFSFGINSAY